MNTFKKVLGLACISACFAVNASTFIQGIKVEPAEIKAGQTAKITISGTEGELVNCGVKLHFGDGTSQDFKLVNKGMLPIVVEHKYDKAGEVKVMAEPKKVTSHLKCGGQNQNAMLKVVALPAVAAAPAVAASKAPAVATAATTPAGATTPVKPAPKATGPACPEGWNLDAKTVNKNSGSFTCTAKVGAKLPDAKLSCAKGLGYYENADKGLIGCRP
jgi:hypothetical protein